MKTQDIIPTLINNAILHINDRFPNDNEAFKAASDQKSWKRTLKCKVPKFLKETDCEHISNLKETQDLYWEYVDILDKNEEITSQSICRRFTNVYLESGLEAAVFTNANDDKILMICWTAD